MKLSKAAHGGYETKGFEEGEEMRWSYQDETILQRPATWRPKVFCHRHRAFGVAGHTVGVKNFRKLQSGER